MNNKIQLEILDHRIESIYELNKLIEKSTKEERNKLHKELYIEVAYFVHTIWENYELSILFTELLSYKTKLIQNNEYKGAILKIRKSIKTIANQILKDDKFNEFELQEGSGWRNPFDNRPTSIDIRDLLEKMRDIDNYQLVISYHQIYSMFSSSDGLNGILNRFSNISESSIKIISDELNSYSRNLQILSFHSNFQNDFLGVNSAIRVQNIYKGLHPSFTTTNLNEQIINSHLRQGERIHNTDILLISCKKIREFFRQKLTTKFSIEASITRFKHYMEIFHQQDESKYSEKYFQKEFESFMFNNGYFALSEGQVGNGRFDNIVLNENNAFLCEHKQIGFGVQNDTKKNVIEKFQKGQIQSKIYHNRLNLLSGLAKDIYIIIFSKYQLRFKDEICDILKDGLNFRFRLICLDKNIPTKISKVNEIDIKEIIK